MSNVHTQSLIHPTTIAEAIDAVKSNQRIQIIGAGSKPAMSREISGAAVCSLQKLAGVVNHQPSEFLITALAGTTLTELRETLDQHQQYLPSDPPFSCQGATIGGTVAAGLSGAGRLRYGGLRDFIVGVRVVDGLGKLITGGGPVVKNAAGYDVPKLMVGSAGCFGAIVEVTLKVFPKPKAQKTVLIQTQSLASAASIMTSLSRSPIDLAAMDATPDNSIWLRIEGEPSSLISTTARIRHLIRQGEVPALVSEIEDHESVWRPLDDGSFAPGDNRLVRVPIFPSRLCEVDAMMEQLTVRRRYSVAANLAWIDWPASRPVQQLDDTLRAMRLGGTVLTGSVPRCHIGYRHGESMHRRVKAALDPAQRFVTNN